MKISTALVTFTAYFTITSAVAVAVATVAEDDMILTAHEGLLIINNHIARDFTAQEQGIIDSCLMIVFNQLYDPLVVNMRLVTGEYTSSAIDRREVMIDTQAYQTYPRVIWKKYYTAVCRDCSPVCGSEDEAMFCIHPEEAKILSPQDRFRAFERLYHPEWERGTCDCLERSGFKTFDSVSPCVLTFSPVSDEVPLDSPDLAADTFVELVKDANLNNFDNDEAIHTTHEGVVLFTSHVSRDLNDAENYFLNMCLVNTFNALHETTESKIEQVDIEVEKLVVRTQFFGADKLSNNQTNPGLMYTNKLRWILIHHMNCRLCLPDCDINNWSTPVAANNWFCDHREKALLLPSKELAKLSMSWMHNMWQHDLCSCLMSSGMEIFHVAQNCIITFPPMTEGTHDSSTNEAE
jgi:hypothetical protein